jgi:ParB family chromosome partitioning protein
MSKKRVFDIDFPDEAAPEASVPTADVSRRGPMATAISENAGALQQRAEIERSIRAENDRLAHEHVRLKREGLITDLIPLDQIATSKLQRDRKSERDEEIDELKTSIKSIGLSNPIRVQVVDDGYELIQGFRRLTAFRELFAETGDPSYGKIPAGLVAEGDALERLYRRMVDENLVRRDISFAEMAILANRYAADAATDASSAAEAVAALYGSAGRQKRSYITHFASLMERLGDALRWPEAIPRALGLELEKRLSSRPDSVRTLSSVLSSACPNTADEELNVLRAFLDQAGGTQATAKKRKARAGAKTTLRIARPEGLVKCTASDGRIELRGEADFSSVDRATLERAVAAFLDAIQSDDD